MLPPPLWGRVGEGGDGSRQWRTHPPPDVRCTSASPTREEVTDKALWSSASLLPQKFLECRDDQTVGFFRPHGHAQCVRQLIGGGQPQNQSARGEEDVGILGGAPLTFRKMDQHKIGDAR